VTTTYPTIAPNKALTAGEQRNLKALIENDYRRAKHALSQALFARSAAIEVEAEELFPAPLIELANAALQDAFTHAQRTWAELFVSVAEAYPQLRISPGNRAYAEDSPDRVPYLSMPGIYVGYPGKETWIAERQMEARKAYEEALAVLAAQELEAQRTVLVRGVGSQEALNVLLEIPAATDLFTNRVLELEQAPAATDD